VCYYHTGPLRGNRMVPYNDATCPFTDNYQPFSEDNGFSGSHCTGWRSSLCKWSGRTCSLEPRAWEQMQVQTPFPTSFFAARWEPNLKSGFGWAGRLTCGAHSEERLRQELQNIDLQPFFPVPIASGSVGIDKPSRGIFNLAASKVGVETGRIMFVGDDLERDYHGAKAAGMKPVLIDSDRKYDSHPSLNRISSLQRFLPNLI